MLPRYHHRILKSTRYHHHRQQQQQGALRGKPGAVGHVGQAQHRHQAQSSCQAVHAIAHIECVDHANGTENGEDDLPARQQKGCPTAGQAAEIAQHYAAPVSHEYRRQDLRPETGPRR